MKRFDRSYTCEVPLLPLRWPGFAGHPESELLIGREGHALEHAANPTGIVYHSQGERMIDRQFLTTLGSTLRKLAVILATSKLSETPTEVAKSLGELADDLDKTAQVMPTKTPRKQWEKV